MNTIMFVFSRLVLPEMSFGFWNFYYLSNKLYILQCHQTVFIPFTLNLSSICYLLNIKNKYRLIVSLVSMHCIVSITQESILPFMQFMYFE